MNNKIIYFYLALFSILLSSCKNKPNEAPLPSVTENIPVEIHLQDLEPGEVFYKNKEPFGEVINLTGEQIIADTVIFKVSESKFSVKGNRLLVKNRGGRPFMLFQYPEMKFLGYQGIFGSGPDEFSDPVLVPTTDSTLVAYLFESSNEKLYKMDREGNIRPSDFSFKQQGKRNNYSDKQLVNLAPNDFIYTESSKSGKSIFRSIQQGDSMDTREVVNLALDPKRKSWTTYIGDFAVNPKQNRMVFAYKYFKMIKFMDLEAKQVRTINFEREEFDESTTYKLNGMDQNVTHYWGVCAQEKFVYFLYSGRTPMEVARENQQKNYYIYVEQYDWNGNPIRKYKLDRWGYFTVDEPSQSIILLSTNDDDPFFVYKEGFRL